MNNINPNVLLQQMMRNSNIANNPIAKNALSMYQRGDVQGLNTLAENLCNERGVKREDIMNKVQNMFRI